MGSRFLLPAAALGWMIGCQPDRPERSKSTDSSPPPDTALDSDTGVDSDTALDTDSGGDSETAQLPDTAECDPAGCRMTGSGRLDTTNDTTGLECLTVSGRGDVDGDGRPDLVVGLAGAGDGANGAAYVARGRDVTDGVLATLAVAAISGVGEEYLGAGSIAVADFNQDGAQDLVLGAPNGASSGLAYLFAGPFPGNRSSTDADGTLSQECAGPDQYCWMGRILASGEFDGDGIPDLVIGNGEWVLAWIIPGPITGDLDVAVEARTWITFDSSANYNDLSVVGDVTGDGLDDLVASTDAWAEPQGAFLFEGGLEGELLWPDAVAYWRAPTEFWAQYRGGIAADLDGDGYLDLAISESQDSEGAYDGAVSVVYGPFSGWTELPAADYVAGHDHSMFGWSLRTVSDLDGDGRGELVVGASGDADNAGRAYVFAGPVYGSWLVDDAATVTLADGDNEDEFGGVVAEAEDLDGDGVNEVVVGAWGEDDFGKGTGAVWVYPGATLLGL